MFTGHDCTRAFALTSTKTKELDKGLDGLTETHFNTLNMSYWSVYIRQYPVVAVLSDPPYRIEDYEHITGPLERRPVAPTAVPEKRRSKCPMRKVARAILNMLPLQLTGPA